MVNDPSADGARLPDAPRLGASSLGDNVPLPSSDAAPAPTIIPNSPPTEHGVSPPVAAPALPSITPTGVVQTSNSTVHQSIPFDFLPLTPAQGDHIPKDLMPEFMRRLMGSLAKGEEAGKDRMDMLTERHEDSIVDRVRAPYYQINRHQIAMEREEGAKRIRQIARADNIPERDIWRLVRESQQLAQDQRLTADEAFEQIGGPAEMAKMKAAGAISTGAPPEPKEIQVASADGGFENLFLDQEASPSEDAFEPPDGVALSETGYSYTDPETGETTEITAVQLDDLETQAGLADDDLPDPNAKEGSEGFERAKQIGELALSIAPISGEIISARDAYHAYLVAREAARNGEVAAALTQGGLATANGLGAIPIIGSVIRLPKGAFKLAQRLHRLQDAHQRQRAAKGGLSGVPLPSVRQMKQSLDQSVQGLKGASLKRLNTNTANNTFADRARQHPNYDPAKAPHPPHHTKTGTYQLRVGQRGSKGQFVRVIPENGRPNGAWIMLKSDFDRIMKHPNGARHLKELYALPHLPKSVVDVELPPGTKLVGGISAGNPKWGAGGGVQFEIQGKPDRRYFSTQRPVRSIRK